MNEDTLNKIKDFVSEFSCTKRDKLSENTTLYPNLGIGGDDAAEFLEVFSDKFSVDMSEFKFSKYFGPEGCNPFSSLYCILFARDKLKKTPITLRDLVEAVENKKWVKK